MGKGDARTRDQSALPSRLEDPEGMSRSEKGPAGWAWVSAGLFIPALFKPPQTFFRRLTDSSLLKVLFIKRQLKG